MPPQRDRGRTHRLGPSSPWFSCCIRKLIVRGSSCTEKSCSTSILLFYPTRGPYLKVNPTPLLKGALADPVANHAQRPPHYSTGSTSGASRWLSCDLIYPDRIREYRQALLPRNPLSVSIRSHYLSGNEQA